MCCGDIIGIGPQPEKTVEKLIQKGKKIISVRGNHEQYLLNGLPKQVHNDKRKMSINEIGNHKWTHNNISEKAKEYIKKLPIKEYIELESRKIYLVHYPIDKKGKYKSYNPKANIEENEKMFSSIDADIFIYGHTHNTNVNNNKNKWYINVGSLGCPKSSNLAKCGILDLDKNNIHVEILNIEYDVKKVIEDIKKKKYPFYEKILQIFYF